MGRSGRSRSVEPSLSLTGWRLALRGRSAGVAGATDRSALREAREARWDARFARISPPRGALRSLGALRAAWPLGASAGLAARGALGRARRTSACRSPTSGRAACCSGGRLRQVALAVGTPQIVAADGVLAVRAGVLDQLAQPQLGGAQFQLPLLAVLEELGRPQDRVHDRADEGEHRGRGRAGDQDRVLDPLPCRGRSSRSAPDRR